MFAIIEFKEIKFESWLNFSDVIYNYNREKFYIS